MQGPFAYAKSVALMAALAVAGCGSLVELPGTNAKAPQIFSVSPLEAVDGTDGREWSIFIEEPTVPGELRSNRIAVRRQSLEISYLAGVQWPEHTANLIRRHLLVSLDNSARFQTISESDIELPADYRLKLDVRDFHVIERAGGNDINMSIAVRLVRNGPVRLIGQTILTSNQQTRAIVPATIADAFDGVLDDVAGQLHRWVVKTLTRSEGNSARLDTD